MKKILVISTILITIIWHVTSVAKASEAITNSAVLKNEIFGYNQPDDRVEKLTQFLEFYHSPLSEFAARFVESADKYQIDWRLVPAITGVESTFGVHIPYNSYNAYGWNNGLYKFNSWEESIAHVTKTLAEKYVARGLDTPWKIAPVYAPPSKTWARNVTFFIDKLDFFRPKTLVLTI
jgi:hypothetical protein